MNRFRGMLGLALAVGAGLMLAGCQGGAASGGGESIFAAAPPSTARTAAATPQKPAAPAPTQAPTAAPATRTAALNGLKSYKVYNTTESLCAQTCRSESRCVSHTFTPIQKINGYVAGQCQFFGR